MNPGDALGLSQKRHSGNWSAECRLCGGIPPPDELACGGADADGRLSVPVRRVADTLPMLLVSGQQQEQQEQPFHSRSLTFTMVRRT
jgi:hypothetical protein